MKNILAPRSLDRELEPKEAREVAAANMALSTLLLHEMRHRRCQAPDARPRPPGVAPSSMPEIQEDEEDASNTAAAAIGTAVHYMSSHKHGGFSAL